MVRNPAHWYFFALMLAALGKRNIKRFGGGNSVVAGAEVPAAADTSARIVGGGGTKHGGSSGLSPESLEMIIMGGLLLGACIALVWCSVGSLFGTGSRRRRGGKWERAAIDESDDDEADDGAEFFFKF